MGWAGDGICRLTSAELPTIESRSSARATNTALPAVVRPSVQHLDAVTVCICICRGFQGDGSDRNSVKTSVPCIQTGGIAAELVRQAVKSTSRRTGYARYAAHHHHGHHHHHHHHLTTLPPIAWHARFVSDAGTVKAAPTFHYCSLLLIADWDEQRQQHPRPPPPVPSIPSTHRRLCRPRLAVP